MSFSVYKFLNRIKKVESNEKLVSQENIIDLLEYLSSADNLSSDMLKSISMDDIDAAINIVNDYNPSNVKQMLLASTNPVFLADNNPVFRFKQGQVLPLHIFKSFLIL